MKQCYDVAPPRVQQYLATEIEHVRLRIKPGDLVLELGCGYGRVLTALAGCAARLVGVDISLSSLHMAQNYLHECDNVFLCLKDAVNMGFKTACFDIVFCIQNGISAFHVDQHALITSAVSVTKPGGTVLFSSYAEEFWQERLDWFRIQSAHDLLGEIDEDKTGDGIIVCKDGFRATTVSRDKFSRLTGHLGKKISIETVDNSSIFCEITV
ncbi:MAG: class I SAM-dependent methyltransferase [candidate division WOR-3 bacterium]|nr:MAG: class I SAM-dependent methyltransferase [candidate division WOR-3 bacterium]